MACSCNLYGEPALQLQVKQVALQYGEGERDMVALSHQFVVENADGSESHIPSKRVPRPAPPAHPPAVLSFGLCR